MEVHQNLKLLLCERQPTDWEKYFQTMDLTKDSYLEFIKKLKTQDTENPGKKMGKRWDMSLKRTDSQPVSVWNK